ncbi:FtsW/RodA/SpoVE family cell cycle protein [Paenibacillus arenosi]|uniref:Rod shape-determining protein RodA n=1 Tax=Paenibacillus arenosi TaxID=2774142 RepID=A0ABR9B5N3_9BACL|nr:FtsW/RodA/SpoVE family cell cycle protein [Paenibacillus arenosi]MBD8500780.1 rod shape-determining protein RodA [Paenibacillus arenosi]
MLNKLKRIDWMLVAILVVFAVISPFIVYSSTIGTKFEPANFEIKTIVFYIIGFVVMLAVTLFDYRLLLKGWYIWMGITILLLIGLFFFGSERQGATGWYELPGGQTFQPAELAKLTLIIAIAQLLGKREGEPLEFVKDLVPIAFVMIIPFGLIVVQPDLGNAMILVVIFIGMLWIGGMKYRHMFVGTAIVGAFIAIIVVLFTQFGPQVESFFKNTLGQNHWYERINTFVDPESATKDESHQSRYALIAIGSGGLSGDGYLQGELKSRHFIPYTYTDAVFVVIGEEFGFQGGALLLLLYFFLIYRMILIAFQCYDLRGSYIIIGIVSMLVFQIFQNVGMMIGLMPITGITLPFISYGGTSLVLNMISMGLVLSVKIHQEKYQLDPD